MSIERVVLKEFMTFNKLDMSFSPNINVICGENSTGKTILIKILYACMKGYAEASASKGDLTKDKIEDYLVRKLQGVFRPDKDSVGRLVSRKRGSNRTDIEIQFDNEEYMHLGFGNRSQKRVELLSDRMLEFHESTPVYIPPKEIISSMENFGSLYSDYHIAFEETYYDLTRLLERPLKKGPNTIEQRTVLERFEEIVDGTIVQRDKNFYLALKGSGEFEMGVLSEGYRKLTTIMHLILSGSLSGSTVLFWDEPETNMNPKLIKPMVDAIIELAKMGVQVFVTTHDYFTQQCFNMAATYQSNKEKKLKYNFVSLYRNGEGIAYENADYLSDLLHNAVMEEFDQLYDREQELIDDDTRK